MKTFFAVFLGILAAVLVIVAVSAYMSRSARERQADELTQTTMMLANGCRGASREQLSIIRLRLEHDEQLISQARGWDDYSPEHEMRKAALHNRLVAAGCFPN